MNRIYPGFHHWWRQQRPRTPAPRPSPLPLYAWPQEPQQDRVPTAPDPLDYGRVALEW